MVMFVADASYFARPTILESKAPVACISRKTNDNRYDSRFQVFTAAARGLPDRSEVHSRTCFRLRVCHSKKRISRQTKFYRGNVCNMMSVPAEGTERLAEILRQMLALSETSRSNDSPSAVAKDSIELFDTHSASGTADVCATQRKHPSNESRDC